MTYTVYKTVLHCKRRKLNNRKGPLDAANITKLLTLLTQSFSAVCFIMTIHYLINDD